MRLYLVRHGQTAYNRDGLGLGRADVPLSDFGRAQAAALARHMIDVPFDAAYSSPLSRAYDTAIGAAGSDCPVVADDDLIELDVGETEGLPFAEMRKRYAGFLEEWVGPEGHNAIMPGGESLQHVAERVSAFLARLDRSEESTVLVASHNFVIRIMLCELFGLPVTAFRSFGVDLASVSIIDWKSHRSTAVVLNDTCHLQELKEVLEPSSAPA